MSDATTFHADNLPPAPVQSDPVIEAKTLQFYYGEGDQRTQILHDIDLVARKGELIIIDGPSGSGKSTLLVLAGTLRRVMDGSLKVLGQELCGAPKRQLVALRRRIGFIFQAHNLFESLTAYENVYMAMQLGNSAPRETQQRIVDLLTKLELGERIRHKPGQLSGGQRQRVAIARGLIHNPEIILADEPTAALDEKNGRVVVDMIKKMTKERGSTVLMVTHDDRILDAADRIVTIRQGNIVSDANVQETQIISEFLISHENTKSVFGELPHGSVAEIAAKMSRADFPAGATIIRQGDSGEEFYFIRSGTVQIEQADETTGAVNKTAKLGAGDFFGEVSLLTGAKRNATVIAESDVVVYTLKKADFNQVVDSIPSFETEVRRALFHRQ